jgi:carbamoyltransferase
MNYILGINAFHADSSACLFKNGELIAAIEEERLNRVKHWSGFPFLSINYCLKQANISFDKIQIVTVNQNVYSNIFSKLIYVLLNIKNFFFFINKVNIKRKRSGIKNLFHVHFGKNLDVAKYYFIDHHLSHLSSAYYSSGFNRAAIVSIDGFGDFSSTVWGFGENNNIKILKRKNFPHSMGIFYQALTQYLGFVNYGDEYKVMGMAAYGSPKFVSEFSNIVDIKNDGDFKLNLDYFNHHKIGTPFKWDNQMPIFENLFTKKLQELLGPKRCKNEIITQRHYDIASTTQHIYEIFFINLLNNIYSKLKIENLALAGGCAMNSLANGKIITHTNFKNFYVQPAAGDAGGSLGSAYYYLYNHLNFKKRNHDESPYWGPSFNNDDIFKTIKEFREFNNKDIFYIKKIENLNLLCKEVALDISNGSVVGWFQGRAEWGPRALGNRSILADPRNKNMKNILNIKIKKREDFRPFAPSILEEHLNDWFEEKHEVPFMSAVFKIKEKMRYLIPAVTHNDGTGRLQTVNEKNNSLFYLLIKNFYEISKVPILLNTSFNENEPMVCNPEEAINCFLRTKMDILVMQNWIIKRK